MLSYLQQNDLVDEILNDMPETTQMGNIVFVPICRKWFIRNTPLRCLIFNGVLDNNNKIYAELSKPNVTKNKQINNRDNKTNSGAHITSRAWNNKVIKHSYRGVVMDMYNSLHRYSQPLCFPFPFLSLSPDSCVEHLPGLWSLAEGRQFWMWHGTRQREHEVASSLCLPPHQSSMGGPPTLS